MTTNASGSLITALINSIANPSAGWTVTSVLNSTTTRLSSVSGSVMNGTGSVGYGSTTDDILTVELKASAVRAVAGSAALAQFTYRSIKQGSTFDEAYIVWNGAEFLSTSTTLDTAIRALATAFMTARDAAAIAALNASPSAPAGATPMDAGLLAALNASLADTANVWRATSRVENSSPTEVTITVGMMSMLARMDLGSPVPAQFTWIGRFDLFGVLIEARVFFGGAEWRTNDVTLKTHVITAASAFLAARQAAITAAL